MDHDTSSNSGASVSSVASPERYHDGTVSSVSLDDPDVRMAAEALGDLRADFVYSPKSDLSPPPRSPQSLGMRQQPEPLLSLITTSHPLLATTIEGATSAYNNSKNYSPRFKSGAEYVEGYVIPIANTVGSVGRKTGVEGSVRWLLERRRPHGAGHESELYFSNKRRKVRGSEEDLRDSSPEPGSGVQTPRASVENSRERRISSASTIDTLPAYDELRAPPYAEHPGDAQNPARNGQAWPSRFIISTSGLSIAMSEESLRSLKFCLRCLRWANTHVNTVLSKVKTTMDEYEQKRREAAECGDHHMGADSDRHDFTAKIGALKADLLKTLESAIFTVGKYAGGALPENARELVRSHLTSLPRRFHLANQKSEASNLEEGRGDGEREIKENAQLMVTLAKEGLDMMAQVSDVLDGTITSAEEWCEKLGRRKREDKTESRNTNSAYMR
ncbi:transcription factor Opi1 [Xylariaceae sp. FL1019]|nr:transcription factor Opi1 [Xylariaceae sp. FL1019]